MIKHARWLPFLVLLAIILAVLSAACTAPSGQPAPGAPPPPAAAVGGDTIMIQNFAFTPGTLTVKSGTTVTWTNNDSVPHTIMSDSGSQVAFSSDSLATGSSFRFAFTSPGTYSYHCSIHPSMKGMVVVT